jgi:beta-glucosidase
MNDRPAPERDGLPVGRLQPQQLGLAHGRRHLQPLGLVLDRRQALQLGLAVGGAAALAACTPAPAPFTTPSQLWTPTSDPVTFPTGYLWGAATSAFQVEGSTTADGRGTSIWDTFCAEPGRVADGATGDPAADHYRRWASDVDLMAGLGLRTYRFSVAWPRIQPSGSGPVNQTGIDFYRRLVEALLTRGIRPGITLYHWDLPQPLQDAGGWPARDTAARFSDYAAIVFEALGAALGDDQADWFTINEPKTTAFVGYRSGAHAPGVQDVDAALAAVHHQLLAHGLAVQAFRASGVAGRIGAALNLLPVYPTSAAAVDASRRVDGVENRLFLDPVLLGRYPDDAVGDQGGQYPASPGALGKLVHDGDLATISTPSDLLAVQYYGVAGVDASGNQVTIHETSDAPWQQIYPEGLYDLLTRLVRDYPAIPLMITENGIPDDTAEGTTADARRVEFLRAHFLQAARAIEAGVPLIGYHVWSLLDNFEWAEGYTQRWGIVRVDFDTQQRSLKDSAGWYRAVIAANAVPVTG